MSKFESEKIRSITPVNPIVSRGDEEDEWLDEIVTNMKDKKLKLSSVDPEEYAEYIEEVKNANN